jgi:hypothetical protein
MEETSSRPDDIMVRLLDFRPLNNAELARLVLDAAGEIDRLRKLGDALANTGGQHGFDEALDDWKDMRGY